MKRKRLLRMLRFALGIVLLLALVRLHGTAVASPMETLPTQLVLETQASSWSKPGGAGPISQVAEPSAETTIYLPLVRNAKSVPDLGGRDPKILVIRYWQAASLLNPHLTGGTKDLDAAAILSEPLANITPEGTLSPALAAEIPTLENGGIDEDLTAITWALRPGVKWADGSDFTADDVVFTYDYCVHPQSGCVNSNAFAGINSVQAIDPLTVHVIFDAPTPDPYKPFVTNYSGAILQKAQFADCLGAAAQVCSEENLSPIGTGPYRLDSFTDQDLAMFVRNPLWRDIRFFNRVDLQGGGDAAGAARDVLETGEADYAWNLQVEPQILMEMVGAGKGDLIVNLATNVERLLINQTNPDPALGDMRSEYDDGNNPHPFLTFKPIPQAMSMAIDRNLIAEQLYGPAGVATCNIIANPPQYVSHSQ